MITEEKYLEARAIVIEYERELYRDKPLTDEILLELGFKKLESNNPIIVFVHEQTLCWIYRKKRKKTGYQNLYSLHFYFTNNDVKEELSVRRAQQCINRPIGTY